MRNEEKKYRDIKLKKKLINRKGTRRRRRVTSTETHLNNTA